MTDESINRVGDAEVGNGTATVLLVLHGKWPGATQLDPDQADALAERLSVHAAHVRHLNDPKPTTP